MRTARPPDRIAVLLGLLLLPALAQAGQGQIIHEVVHSVALEDNLLGDSPDRSVTVYLPPGYDTSPTRRYATLYLLHGFTGTDRLWIDGGGYFPGFNIQAIADRVMSQPDTRPYIIVMPDCNNMFMGSFYRNSPVTGNWEDFIVDELVPHVDAAYRTIPARASRGLAGHSMGGYGTLHLGMNYPETFSTLYAMSPGMVGLVDWEGSIELGPAVWPPTLQLGDYSDFLASSLFTMIHIAGGAALAPNPDNPPFYGDLPYELIDGQAVAVPAVQQAWEAATPLGQLGTHTSQLRSLRAIRFDAGTADLFQSIPVDCRAFSAALDQLGIAHVFQEYDGDHLNRVQERVETKLLPFFSTVLAHGGRGLTVSSQLAGGSRRAPRPARGTTTSWAAIKQLGR